MMFSPAKAATKAGVSRKTVMNSIKSLELPAHRNNQNHWVIRPIDLANWIRERDKRSPKALRENARGIPHLAPTPQHELDALKAQLQLSFVKQRLEASEQDNEKLKQEVVELKAELKESRDQLSQVWREVTDKLVSLARPHKRRGPFVLTEDMRADGGKDNITNLFID
ncbi:helix-turn-helix domain-containing protein [Lentibacter algarum]|uniref:helix-turn-helix domain-containing protein n=1 Tax=Lentibacter algarum TaxID=576131 RepID=UPI00339D4EBD